jgi:enoyl-CoA hydratase/carnithine racemase
MFLVTAVGPNRAARLLLLGEGLSAQEAHEAELVYAVDDESELLGRARDLANRLARSDPTAIQRAKACLHSAWADLYETAYRSELKTMVEAGQARWPDLASS